jgi:serine/threonine protein kinase
MLQPSRPTPPRHPCPAEPDQAAATPSPAGDATVHTRLVNGRPAPRLAPPIGQCLGDFEVLAELGRGGMGVVYKARQRGLDRLVALKLLPRERLHDSVRAARFQRETRAAAALSHPNIVSSACQRSRYSSARSAAE